MRLQTLLFLFLLFVAGLVGVSPAYAQEATFPPAPNPGHLRDLVRNQIIYKGLPYQIKGSNAVVFLRSERGGGSGNKWKDNGQQHAPTLTKICEILGYRTYVRSSCLDSERSGRYPKGKCNFHSPSDNDMTRFNPAINNFSSETAKDKYGKTWVASITCRDPISQCNDAQDNDGDGAIDFPNDFACSDAADNDEFNPMAACQNARDDDGDGLLDLGDPGCASYQDNSEKNLSGAICDNGLDDDSDGKIDFPADPGCLSPQDSIEVEDCSDNIDNDADGSTDYPSDVSCETPQDTDEANPKSACQDKLDNDADGLFDLQDPGCRTTQDNDETDPRTACEDGIDNDQDGLIDLQDPGCVDSKDLDEGNSAGVEPTADCALQNADGSYTAYFGYDNLSGSQSIIPIGSGQKAGTNAFGPGKRSRGQPTRFQSGRVRGAFGVTFDGSPLTWTVGAAGLTARGAVASSAIPACAPVIPVAECVSTLVPGDTRVVFGYQNDNPFAVSLPAGALNQFTTAPGDRGQTTVFQPGRKTAQFSVSLPPGQQIQWRLNGKVATGAQSLPACSGILQCPIP